MFSFFKSNRQEVVVFYWVYLILFRVCFFIGGPSYSFTFSPNEPLSHLIFSWLPAHGAAQKIVSLILSAVLTFIQALLINGIVNGNKMTTRKTYLPGLTFIIYASFFPQMLICSPALIALTFVILCIASLFNLSKSEKAYGEVFDVGFLAALAALFYFPAVVLILFAYVAMATVRSFNSREYIAVLLGFLAPLFLVFTYYLFVGMLPGNILPDIHFQSIRLTTLEWWQAGAFLFSLVLWFFMLQGVLYSSLIQVRKFATLLILLSLQMVIAFLGQHQFSLSHFCMLCPAAGIVSAMVFVQIRRNVLLEIIHLILILLVLTGQYLPIINAINKI